jgi:hypothetical protein
MTNLNENIIEDTACSGEQKSGVSLEISENEGVDGAVSQLDVLATAINRDQPMTELDLDELGLAFGNMKVDVGGRMMTVEEAKKIPDFKKTAEIWKEIRDGNNRRVKELTLITQEIIDIVCRIARGRDMDLSSLVSVKDVTFPKFITPGSLDLHRLTRAKNLVLPENIEEFLLLDSLVSAEGVTFPKSVGRNLYLTSLRSAQGLVLPSYVGGKIYLGHLAHITDDEGRYLAQYIDQILATPETIAKIAQFKKL